MRDNGLKMHQVRFRLDIRKLYFFRRAVSHWQRLPGEVVESLSLEVFKNHGDMALRDIISGDGLGLDLYLVILRGRFQP